MIDLTKMSLEEVQKLVTEDKKGTKVRIYSIEGTKKYPVHGAVEISGGWGMREWTKTGKCIEVIEGNKNDLKIPTKQPDFTKLPKDVLVKVGNTVAYTTGVHQANKEIAVFAAGRTSKTTSGYITCQHEKIELMPGDWVVWDGNGRCPLPKGVEVEIMCKGSRFTITVDCSLVEWGCEDDGSVIAYRITGKLYER